MTTPDTADVKSALRKEIIARRKALPAEEMTELSCRAQERLMRDPAWAKAQNIAMYVPMRKETDTNLLMDAAWAAGKNVFFPRVHASIKGVMHFCQCTSRADLEPGVFGIMEPDLSKTKKCLFAGMETPTPQEDYRTGLPWPDLVLMAGVAFDRQGHRLGYGGGYYDRFMEKAAQNNASSVFLAFAYDFQIMDSIPYERWDKPVHGYCTEKELVWLR